VKPRLLVAGIGNIFFGDDGFGSAVLARLSNDAVDGVKFADFGIGVVHLAFELLGDYELAVVVDAVSRGAAPGTLFVIEPDAASEAVEADAHRMNLGSVFAFVRRLGGSAPPVVIVGCEPETLDAGVDLSAAVSHAVEAAVPLVRRIVRERLSATKEQQCTEV
jgi:hydrogenase maturation protease